MEILNSLFSEYRNFHNGSNFIERIENLFENNKVSCLMIREWRDGKNGNSILHTAVEAGDATTIEYLLKICGVDPFYRRPIDNMSPADLAQKKHVVPHLFGKIPPSAYHTHVEKKVHYPSKNQSHQGEMLFIGTHREQYYPEKRFIAATVLEKKSMEIVAVYTGSFQDAALNLKVFLLRFCCHNFFLVGWDNTLTKKIIRHELPDVFCFLKPHFPSIELHSVFSMVPFLPHACKIDIENNQLYRYEQSFFPGSHVAAKECFFQMQIYLTYLQHLQKLPKEGGNNKTSKKTHSTKHHNFFWCPFF